MDSERGDLQVFHRGYVVQGLSRGLIKEGLDGEGVRRGKDSYCERRKGDGSSVRIEKKENEGCKQGSRLGQ